MTATDIVAILGLSSWDSRYSLYWRKRGVLPDVPDTDRFRLGRHMEPYVVERWQQVNGYQIIRLGGLYRSVRYSWQLATPDRVVYQHPDPERVVTGFPLEVKSWADADRHSWDDGPPAAVRAQVLWQMDVLGATAGYAGVVFLPSGEFREYTIEHISEEELCDDLVCRACIDQSLMRVRGSAFWYDVENGLVPSVDGSAATLAALKALSAPVKGETAAVDPNLWEMYLGWKKAVTVADAKMKEVEAMVREQIGDATEIQYRGKVAGRRVRYTVKAHARKESVVDKIMIKPKEKDSE